MSVPPTSAGATGQSVPTEVAEFASLLEAYTNPREVKLANYWPMDDGLFMQALRLVLERAPYKVAAAWPQIQQRLTEQPEMLGQLRDEAAGQIRVINRQALVYLQPAPLDFRLAVLTGIDPLYLQPESKEWWTRRVFALEMLLDALTEMDEATARTMMGEIKAAKFEGVHPVLLYRSVCRWINYRSSSRNVNGEFARWLEETAGLWLRAAGYLHGIIEVDNSPGEPLLYLKVTDGDVTTWYVQEPTRSVTVEGGSRVAFDPSGEVLAQARGAPFRAPRAENLSHGIITRNPALLKGA